MSYADRGVGEASDGSVRVKRLPSTFHGASHVTGLEANILAICELLRRAGRSSYTSNYVERRSLSREEAVRARGG